MTPISHRRVYRHASVCVHPLFKAPFGAQQSDDCKPESPFQICDAV